MNAKSLTARAMIKSVDKNKAPWPTYRPSGAAPKPNIIIEIQGGLVTGIVTDRACRAVVVDRDIEGTFPENLHDYPVVKGKTEKVSRTDWGRVDRSPGFVRAAIKMLKL
jgi:hypothetical protein